MLCFKRGYNLEGKKKKKKKREVTITNYHMLLEIFCLTINLFQVILSHNHPPLWQSWEHSCLSLVGGCLALWRPSCLTLELSVFKLRLCCFGWLMVSGWPRACEAWGTGKKTPSIIIEVGVTHMTSLVQSCTGFVIWLPPPSSPVFLHRLLPLINLLGIEGLFSCQCLLWVEPWVTPSGQEWRNRSWVGD